ncbi:MAG: response regulator transcription factor [Dehalococcoidia bacterium]|nr:MAG: response regulator transcription factor [Dehalococcoidia bacterium]
MHNILFVDATEEIRPMASVIEEAGFGVAHAELDGVLAEARSETPSVLVFSMLGRSDAPAIRNLLRSADMPHGVASIAVIRSDQLGTLDFSIGFDDFVVYPALSEEVTARVRRAIWLKSGVESDNTLRTGDLHIDLANYKAYVGGRPIDLTYKEFELLRFLATNQDKVFTREALLNRVWGYDFYGGARTVDVHIRRLRSKIEDRAHTFIETVRNVGYRFHLP